MTRIARKLKPPLGMIRKRRFSLIYLVGATGFEPATSATPLQRATKLRHAPTLSCSSRESVLAETLPKDEAYSSDFPIKCKRELRFPFNRLSPAERTVGSGRAASVV